MTRGLSRLTTALLLTFGLARLDAHDTTPPPVVDVLITTQGAQLTVVVGMPVAVLSDVNLPRDPSGLLSRDLEQPLQLVARDVAASLEIEQGDERVPMPAMRAALTSDGAFVTIELTYLLRDGAGPLSARLHTFRAGRDVVPTIARFVVSPGVTRTFTVTGDPERVVFAPTPVQVLRQFLSRGASAVLNGSSFLLFALCLAVPFGRHASRRAAWVALVAGQGLASVLTAGGAVMAASAPLAVMQSIAASAIVVAALQGLGGRLSRWLWPLALVFGVANGFSVGDTFHHALPFAGDSPAVAYAGFLLVILGGQLWMLALLWSAIGLLCRWGVPERVADIAVSVYAGHAALHGLGDSARAVAESSAITADQFLTALTIAWALVVIVVGILETVRAGGRAQTLDAAGGRAQ